MKIIQNNTFNCYQKFFCERVLELIHRSTIDSHRVRVMNSKLILQELIYICEGWINGRIHDFRTVESCKMETIKLLKEDEVFVVKIISKDYFITFLSETIIEKENNGIRIMTNLIKLKNIVAAILLENERYNISLFDKICYYIDNPVDKKDEFLTFKEIDKLTSYLMTSLIGLGYHKSYLSITFNKLMIDKKRPSFSFSEIQKSFSRIINAGEKKYRVWYKFYSTEDIYKSLKSFSVLSVFDEINEAIPNTFVAKEFKKFNTRNSIFRFIAVYVEALDYFSALYKSKTIMAECFDILNLGFGNVNSNITDRAYVVDTHHPEKARFQEVRYVLDGEYKYGQILFDKIYDKIPKLLQKNYVHDDAKEKIKSVFHYLRLGNEALEIEHKIINYWFGLEYLFSNPTDNSFKRIITYLPKLQAISYIKRNVIDMYEKALILNENKTLVHISKNDYSCFDKYEFYNEVKKELFDISPLISYRAWLLEHRIFGKGATDKREDYVNNHIVKLEQQIRRIYNVRNEIVHEAQFNTNNESLASNLKYYLVFSLSIILDHFLEYSASESITIDDLLQLQELKFDYLKKSRFPIDEILNITDSHKLLGG